MALFLKYSVANIVTTASHMPRSVALFKTNGMRPIPAPIGHRVKEIQKFRPAMFFPSAKGIDKLEQVFYEYPRIARFRLRGQISSTYFAGQTDSSDPKE